MGNDSRPKIIRFYDLFGGVGGFRLGLQNAGGHTTLGGGRVEETRSAQNLPSEGNESNGKGGSPDFRCVGYCELDKQAVQIYNKNFSENHAPTDARRLDPSALPEFDLLCAGFPCQSFSMAGKRGGFEDARGTLFFEIARVAEVVRPRLLLLENVKGLLSHDEGWTFYRILSVLDEMGYDCEWEVLNSKHFGVPQNRERVFIVGHLRGQPFREVFPLGEGSEVPAGARPETQRGRKWLRSVDSNYHKGGARQMIALNERRTGKEPVPAGEHLLAESALIHSRGIESRHDGQSHSLKGAGGGSSKNFTIIRMDEDAGHYQDRIYGRDGLAPALPATSTGGNSVPKIANTITDGWLMDTKHHSHPMNQYRIRRLTPIECERLQGFPDGWTAGVSDTQRYRMMGNAVTVNVIQAIGEKILASFPIPKKNAVIEARA